MFFKKWKRPIIFAVIFGFAAFLVYEAFVTQFPELWVALKSGKEADIERFLEDSDRWTGCIILCLIQIVQVISIVIPSAPIQVAGGMVNGAVRGYLICHLSYVFANFLVIFCVRKFSGLTELIGNSNQEKVKKTVDFLNQGDPFVTIILLCLIPLIPNGIIPYAASHMDIRIKDFTKAVFLGSIYPILSMTLAGHFILTGDYLVSAVLVVLNVAVVALMYWKRKRISEFFLKRKEMRKERRHKYLDHFSK